MAAVQALLVGLLLCRAAHAATYECVHDSHEQPKPSLTRVKYASDRKRAVPAPIRIHFDTTYLQPGNDVNYTCYSPTAQVIAKTGGPYNCSASDVLTQTQVNLIANVILPEAYRRISSYLSVSPVIGNLTVYSPTSSPPPPNPPSCFSCWGGPSPPAGCFQPLIVPETYRTTGVAADLVVFVVGRPVPDPACQLNIGQCVPPFPITSNVLAFAGECAYDQQQRPVAGYINFNPARTPASLSEVTESVYMVAVHELTHVLGFSEGKYSSYWNPGTNRTRPLSEVKQTVGGKDYIVLQAVKDAVRSHFGCASLTGALIEDGGGSGTAGSHWELLAFGNELMTGRTSILPIMSNVTLAFLSEMGWYQVNWQSSAVDTLTWGNGMNCQFGAGASGSGSPPSCSTWPAQAQQPPYRCSAGQEACTFDRSAAAICKDPTRTTPPAPDPLTGNCPLLQPYSNLDCTDPTTQPRTGSQPDGESAGPSSRCFDTTLAQGPTGSLYGKVQGCFETACAGPTRLKIKIGGLHYSCPQSGTVTPIDYSGELTCPSDNVVCVDAVNDPWWPEFASIDPAGPSPGDTIYVIGTGFSSNITSVTAAESCGSLEILNYTHMRCTLAGYEAFANPIYVLTGVSIVIRDNRDRTAVGLNVFKVPADSTLQLAFQWMRDNALYTGLIAAGVLLLIVGLILLCVCCCRKPDPKRKYKNRR